MTKSRTKQIIRILSFVLLGLSLTGKAQVTKLDSLRNLFNTHNDQDTIKARALIDIANFFMDDDQSGFGFDSAGQYLEKALELSKDIDYKRGQLISYNYLGRLSNYKGQRHLSIQYFHKALMKLKETSWPQMTADINMEMGHIYYAMHTENKSSLMNLKAMSHYKQALTLSERINDIEISSIYKAMAYGAMAKCYGGSRSFDSASHYITLALQFTESEFEDFKFFRQEFRNSLIGIYSSKGDYDVALNLSRDLIKEYDTSKDDLSEQKKCHIYLTMAEIFLVIRKPDSAYSYLSRARDAYPDILKDVKYSKLLVDYYLQSGKHLNALQLSDTLLGFRWRPGANHSLYYYYKTSAEANAKLNRYKEAYNKLRDYQRIYDSLHNESIEAKIIQQQADYEALINAQEIKLLEEQENANELTIAQQKKLQLLSILVVLLLIIVVVIVVSRYRLEQKAKRDQAKLFQETDQLKSRFFANISHEFRTPLTLILGPLAERISTSANENDKSNLSIAYRNAQKLLNLVNQLLDLSKLESKNLRLKASYQNLIPLLKQLASQFLSIAASRAIDFKMNHPDELMLWLDTDKAEKIMVNLLSNAFKFTPVGGSIFVEVRLANSDGKFQNGSVEIDVSDSGIGIAPDKTEKIFDRFYQVNDSNKREYEGTGIGLALVKELVELHYGEITVFSEPGKGSTFNLKLPLGKDHLLDDEIVGSNVNSDWNGKPLIDGFEPKNTNEEISGLSEKPFVLIVEDNADLREYLTSNLKNGFNILAVKNGRLGVEETTTKLPDIVISDLMMPEMDGLELCNKLKADERTSHIPIILLTAKADMQSKIEGLHLGADDYIAKPFEMPELEARIQNLIQNRKKLRSAFSKSLEIRPSEIKAESMDDRFLKKTLLAVEDHIADEQFSVEALALEVGMSNVQLYRKLKALTGKTPNEVIRNLRLDRSHFLLNEKAGNVSEVAYLTGFRNTSYFAKCFKERFGISPSEIKGQA